MNKLKNVILGAMVVGTVLGASGCGNNKAEYVENSEKSSIQIELERVHDFWASKGIVDHAKEECVKEGLRTYNTIPLDYAYISKNKTAKITTSIAQSEIRHAATTKIIEKSND